MSPKQTKPIDQFEPDYEWVETLRLKLVMPGKKVPITRAACDRLINKFSRDRVYVGLGRGRRAGISKEISKEVKRYFDLKHQGAKESGNKKN